MEVGPFLKIKLNGCYANESPMMSRPEIQLSWNCFLILPFCNFYFLYAQIKDLQSLSACKIAKYVA